MRPCCSFPTEKRFLLRIKTFLSFSEGLTFILNILQFVDFFQEKRKLFERKTSVRIYVISILFGLRNRQKFSQIILAAANERKTYFPNPSILLAFHRLIWNSVPTIRNENKQLPFFIVLQSNISIEVLWSCTKPSLSFCLSVKKEYLLLRTILSNLYVNNKTCFLSKFPGRSFQAKSFSLLEKQ